MQILPRHVALWKPYCERGKVPLAKALAWLEKEAVSRRFDVQAAHQAMFVVMDEVEKGKKFSLEGCDCGCELKDPHTAILHHMGKVMQAFGEELERSRSEALEGVWRQIILAHIAEANRSDTEEWVPKEAPAGKVKRFWRFLTKPRLVSKHWRYK